MAPVVEAMHAHLAIEEGRVVGLAHFLFHRNMTRDGFIVYARDL